MDFPQAFISAGAEYADIGHFVPAPFFRKNSKPKHSLPPKL